MCVGYLFLDEELTDLGRSFGRPRDPLALTRQAQSRYVSLRASLLSVSVDIVWLELLELVGPKVTKIFITDYEWCTINDTNISVNLK